MYTPRFGRKGYEIIYESSLIGFVSRKGVYTANISSIIEWLPKKCSVRDYPDLDTLLAVEKIKYPDIEMTLAGHPYLFWIDPGNEFLLKADFLRRGKDGLAALLPIATAISTRLFLDIGKIYEQMEPDFIIAGKGLEGEISIDMKNEVALIEKPVKYNLNLFYLEDRRGERINIKAVRKIVEEISVLDYRLIEAVTSREDPKLKIFEEFFNSNPYADKGASKK